jgi:hypothetical protein
MTLPRPLACCALFALACLPAAAAEPTEPVEDKGAVVVSAIRAPELKSYRVMLAGLDAFDEHHALAPKAPLLRFKLRARDGAPSVDMADLALRIAGETTSIALPLASDHTFILPRDALAEREDADLLLNKKKGGYRWHADVHSDGVPEGMRRLGDLRLECQVIVAVAKKEIGFMLRTLVSGMLRTSDWCMAEKLNFGTPSARALDGATLIAGERRVALTVSKDGHNVSVPIGERDYPDDSLIELQFAADSANGGGAR